MIGDIWYRFIDNEYQGEWGEPEQKIICVEFRVVEETPSTVVLVRAKQIYPDGSIPDWAERKRVLKSARRRFAYPSKALALNSYRHRKDWQISHAARVLARAEACRAAVAVVEGLI